MILLLATATAGLSAFSVLLGQAGEGPLAAVALGSFLLGAFGFVAAIFLQFGPAVLAARVRRATGTTPGWLEPMWTAAGWAETTYIILASLAYVVWGLGMVSSGFPSAWAVGEHRNRRVVGSRCDDRFRSSRVPAATPAGPHRRGCGSGDLMTNSSLRRKSWSQRHRRHRL
jgi:hypothetical protein